MCDALGVERVSVVGNSMGGFIGGELALVVRHPRGPARAGVGGGPLDRAALAQAPRWRAARVVATGAPYTRRLESPVVRRPRLRRAAMQLVLRYPERVSVPLAQELVLSFGKPGFVAGLEAILDYSYRDRLPDIEIPVLIVWGRNDMLVPVDDAYRYAELIGDNARVVIFEDTGHAPMLERPSRFNALLRGFLAGETAPEEGVAGVHAG